MESLAFNPMLMPTGRERRISSAVVLARGTARRSTAEGGSRR